MNTPPVRIVVFYGPHLRSAHDFVMRLVDDARFDVVGIYCQAPGEGWRHRLADVIRRRGPLGVPVYAAAILMSTVAWVRSPFASFRRRRAWRNIDPPVRYVDDLHGDAVLSEVRLLGADVGAVYGGPILRPELFDLPARGTLGIHHGRLPAYRGKKTTFWEIWEGEESAGVTIQRINAGVDTGDIVAEAEVPIGRRSYERVWRDVQHRGIDLFVEALAGDFDRVAGGARPPAGPVRFDPTFIQLLALPIRRRVRRNPASRP